MLSQTAPAYKCSYNRSTLIAKIKMGTQKKKSYTLVKYGLVSLSARVLRHFVARSEIRVAQFFYLLFFSLRPRDAQLKASKQVDCLLCCSSIVSRRYYKMSGRRMCLKMRVLGRSLCLPFSTTAGSTIGTNRLIKFVDENS